MTAAELINATDAAAWGAYGIVLCAVAMPVLLLIVMWLIPDREGSDQ